MNWGKVLILVAVISLAGQALVVAQDDSAAPVPVVPRESPPVEERRPMRSYDLLATESLRRLERLTPLDSLSENSVE